MKSTDGRDQAARAVWHHLRGNHGEATRCLHGLLAQGGSPLDRAFALNLRGVLRRGAEERLADFQEASDACPGFAVPAYNEGVVHKLAQRWPDAARCFRRALELAGPRSHRLPVPEILEEAALWNLAHCAEAAGQLSVEAAGPRYLGRDLGLAQARIHVGAPYTEERVWILRLRETRARILSVVRYACSYQFGDEALLDRHGSSDFLVGAGPERGALEPDFHVVHPLRAAGYALHRVHGAPASPEAAMTLTEKLREAGLHIEVWSLTMRLPGDAPTPEPRPLCAGLVVGPPGAQDPLSPRAKGTPPDPLTVREVAERAASVLDRVAREMGVELACPSLQSAAGNELAELRHTRLAKRLGIS